MRTISTCRRTGYADVLATVETWRMLLPALNASTARIVSYKLAEVARGLRDNADAVLVLRPSDAAEVRVAAARVLA